MKIAMVAPPWYPIPPPGYGGIELIVAHLTDGLVARGHDVTLYASCDSKTKAKLKGCFKKAPSEKIGEVYSDLLHAFTAYDDAYKYDIIHDHSGQIGPVIGSFVKTPVLFTLHGPATENAKRLFKKIGKRIYFNAISEYQRKCFSGLNFIATIYNAIDLDSYPFIPNKDSYLLFLGRMNEQKGAHIAVEVANRLKTKLKMVTKITEPHEKKYFNEKVKPLMSENIELIGVVDVKTKAKLYGKATCTLFPIQWPEPFGLVMAESMATGTPVVAMRDGAVPEVVADGKTGFIVETVKEMAEAVKKVDTIAPANCRKLVEERFGEERMVRDYEKTYRKILELKTKKPLTKKNLSYTTAAGE